MRFAKVVFWIAAIWGVLVIAPLFFIFDLIGRQDPPAITHPLFYYGFACTALAWQFAFIVIATDPARFRLMMLPSIFEKFSYAAAAITIYLHGGVRPGDLMFGAVDLVLGFLFVIAFMKTKSAERRLGMAGTQSA
jgi:hypothetical protein